MIAVLWPVLAFKTRARHLLGCEALASPCDVARFVLPYGQTQAFQDLKLRLAFSLTDSLILPFKTL
jgi:hypothetical protein